MTECAPSSSGRSSAAPCCSLRRRLQVGDKWAQKTVPALAQLSVSPVITGSPLGRCLRGWGEVQEVRPVPPPSSSDGGGTGRSSSGRRRLGGGSTAGGVSALQTVRHDHLEPQTRVPIPPSLHILTCVSHHSHSRRSLDIRPTALAIVDRALVDDWRQAREQAVLCA